MSEAMQRASWPDGHRPEAGQLRRVGTIAVLEVRRFFRSGSNLVFAFAVPFLMILLIGMVFGGGQAVRVGIVDPGGGELSTRLASELESAGGDSAAVEVTSVGSHAELERAIERGEYHAGLVLPADYDTTVRAGRSVELTYLTRDLDIGGADAGSLIRAVVAREATILAAGEQAEGTAPVIEVDVRTAGDAYFPAGFSGFAFSAPPIMLLFVFMMALGSGLFVLEARMNGVSRRMYAGPTAARTIMFGQAAGKLAITLGQALLTMLGAAVLFGVNWGDPLGAAAVIVLFATVASGAAMLLGALVQTDAQGTTLATLIGLGLGAIGGAMLPLDAFGDTMRQVAHITPHAWAYEAFAELIRHDAGLAEILPQLGALAGFAVVLFGLGLLALRRALT